MSDLYSYKFDFSIENSNMFDSVPSVTASGAFDIDYTNPSIFHLQNVNITANGKSLSGISGATYLNADNSLTYQPIFTIYSQYANPQPQLTLSFTGKTPGTVYANFYGEIYDPSLGTTTSKTFYGFEKPIQSSPALVCFTTGTQIITNRGEVAVEDLQIGDLAVTASGAHKPIRWIGHRLVEAADHAAPQDVWPVRITAGALAMGVPVRDLLVSPDHCLVFDDVLVPAKHLINGATIRQEPVEAVGYWHIELDSHEALLAEGAPAESYRDCGMHAFFEGAEGWGHRVGDKAPVALLAPHALSGPRLHGVKAILIARAKHLGARRVEDPGLQVVADGQVLTPASIDNRRFTFAVPEGTQTLVLRSRSSVPAHWIAENEDRRTLGVRVSELRADGTAVAMADAQLEQGWNVVEPNGQERWTEGEAHLPVCRELSFQADWFLGYPVETVSEPMPVNATVSFAAPVLRLVANG